MRSIQVLFAALLPITFLCEGAPCAEKEPQQDSQILARKLDQVARLEIQYKEARKIVQEIGRSGNGTHTAGLKAVARAFPAKHANVTFDALYSLWLMGEPKAYFIDNANSFKENAHLAAFSIQILAFDPDPDVTKKLLAAKLSNEDLVAQGFNLGGFMSVYNAMQVLDHQFRTAPSKDKQIHLAMGGLAKIYGVAIDGYSPDWDLTPPVVWGRARLWKLSREEPAKVAAAILDLRLSEIWFEADNDGESERNQVDGFQVLFLKNISDEAKKQYNELRKRRQESLQK